MRVRTALKLSLSAFFLPEQDQVSWVRKEIAIAPSKDPPFQPYLTPKIFALLRIPADSGRVNARKRWLGFSKQAKRSLSPQELTIQAFTLYRWRFLFAADLCQAWLNFGGLGPQLAHLSTVLHLGITETVGAALAYHRLLGQKLRGGDRKRTDLAVDFATLLAMEIFTLEEQTKKEIASAVDTDAKDKASKQKADGKGKKGDQSSTYRGNNDASNREANPTRDTYYRRETDNRRNDRPRPRRQNNNRQKNNNNRQQNRQNQYGPNNGRQNTGR